MNPYRLRVPPGTTSNERYEINLNGKPVIFSRDDNGGVSGLSAVFTLRPDTVGSIAFNNATASFENVTGYQRVQDFFGRIQRQEVYGRSVISGNNVAVDVLPFSEDGRPDDFFGLSGKISLDLSVSPTEVHIGDPMTLNLTISGMNNTDLDIPQLSRYLGAGIDIPDTRSSAKVEGTSKTITQTIRIKDPAIQLVPPIKFSYFDSETGSYEYASSEAVPIKVLDTKVITASELEGGESDGPEKRKITLEKTREGIYYNYSGKQLLAAERPVAGMLTGSVLIKILLLLLLPRYFLCF